MPVEGAKTTTPTLFIALHNFKAEEQTDLPLEKGQLVIGNFLEDDWWVGDDPAAGTSGVFPANFVAEENSEAANKCLKKLAKKDPQNKHVLASHMRLDGISAKAALKSAVATVKEEQSKSEEAEYANDKTDDLVEVKIEDNAFVGDEMADPADSGDEDGESKMEQTSQEAAASAAAASVTKAPVAQVKSVWRRWKPKIWMAAIKCFFALLSFCCLAGSQFHNISFTKDVTIDGFSVQFEGEGPSAVWYIVTAVQFSIAWGILMWMFEFALVVVFVLRMRGDLPDALLNITDKHPQFFLAYDMVSLFMLSVAGFNMGAAASLPGKVIKLLLETNVDDLTSIANCTIAAASSTVVDAVPAASNSTTPAVDGSMTSIDNLNICESTFFFFFFLLLVDVSCCNIFF
jgi:hypothetical protein